jgi:hypothetical protein
MKPYGHAVSIGKLFAILFALAVVLAPVAANASAAVALPGGMQMAMMDQAGHCQMTPHGDAGHHQSDGKSCCVSMCMAVAVAPSVPDQASPVREQIVQFAPAKSYRGLPAEIATPPPRIS